MALLSAAAGAEPLVGPSVGNADLLASEGSRLYNEKQYAQAAEAFLKATRANPANVQACLQLARSYHADKQLRRACYAYRVYLKSVPETPERKKAQDESGLCERQLRSAKKQPPDPTRQLVELKAAFFAALEARRLHGPGSAAESLGSLVREGLLGPELGELAAKLHSAASSAADELHRRALAGEQLSSEALRTGKPLYTLAAEVGPTPERHLARGAFLEGMAALQSGDFPGAETLFAMAAAADGSVREYELHRALAIFKKGDRPGALKAMEAHLPDDPRTAVLRAALALGDSPEAGAAELERLLFSRRFSQAR